MFHSYVGQAIMSYYLVTLDLYFALSKCIILYKNSHMNHMACDSLIRTWKHEQQTRMRVIHTQYEWITQSQKKSWIHKK